MAFLSLSPQQTVEQEEVPAGLRMLLLDGVCSQTMGVMTGGAFLVAFALLLGASNWMIGLLAAIGPFAQILQIPAIFLVDKTRRRKMLVVVSSILSRSFWVGIALIVLLPAEIRVQLFLGGLFAYFALGAISGSAFNSWMRDFVPEDLMGGFFAKRMAISIALGAILSILAAAGVDLWKQYLGQEIVAYCILFTIGSAAGITGAVLLSRIPEPHMPSADDKGLLRVLIQPFRDAGFRRLLIFLGSWNFAVSIAGPFFVVYMLQRLGLSMTMIMALAVASQLVNVLFLRIWGRLADRFTNKSVLTVSGPLFMLSILLWVFTTVPEKHFLTLPLLVTIHVLSGVSTAGVSLCSGNIALKSAPRGSATAYLATNSIVSGMAATVGPILGGVLAGVFATQELSLNLQWASEGGGQWVLPAISLRGLDFLFLLSFVMGLYALHRLLAVEEKGEVEEKVVVGELFTEVRKGVRHVSNVAGLRHLTYFPYYFVKTAARTVAGRNGNATPESQTEENGPQTE